MSSDVLRANVSNTPFLQYLDRLNLWQSDRIFGGNIDGFLSLLVEHKAHVSEMMFVNKNIHQNQFAVHSFENVIPYLVEYWHS